MDGAAAHKRQIKRVPTGNDRKDKMLKWLRDNAVAGEPEGGWEVRAQQTDKIDRPTLTPVAAETYPP